jgi:hypothetical protein
MSLAETPTSVVRTPPTAFVDDPAALIWNARTGGVSDPTILFDSNDRVVLAYENARTFPGEDADRTAHERAARVWADSRDTTLPEAGAFLVLDPDFEADWSQHIAETYDRPLVMLEYAVDFAHSKWRQYDASIYARADIPGMHGTLRKEVKVQGFPSHRPAAADEVQMWAGLSHLETGHVFEADDSHGYTVPDACDHDAYPLLPAVLTSVYNMLFADVARYRELLTEALTVCERCGVFDESHSERGLPVMDAVDPDGGWRREYCTNCYAQVLCNEYGVLPEIARLYVAHEHGESITDLARKTGETVAYVEEMLGRLDDAVKRGGEF